MLTAPILQERRSMHIGLVSAVGCQSVGVLNWYPARLFIYNFGNLVLARQSSLLWCCCTRLYRDHLSIKVRGCFCDFVFFLTGLLISFSGLWCFMQKHSFHELNIGWIESCNLRLYTLSIVHHSFLKAKVMSLNDLFCSSKNTDFTIT